MGGLLRIITAAAVVSYALLPAGGAVQFFVRPDGRLAGSPPADPAHDRAFQSALTRPFTEFGFQSYGSGYIFDPSPLLAGAVVVRPCLLTAHGYDAAELALNGRRLIETWPGIPFVEGIAGGGPDGAALLNRTFSPWGDARGAAVEFTFSSPVEGFGTWVLDDTAEANGFVLLVTENGGASSASPVLESGNGTTFAVEGFIGVVSLLGITRVVVQQRTLAGVPSNADFFYLDHIQVGGAAPPAPPCSSPVSDLDGDGDVDQTDFGLLQRCLTGPATPLEESCACADWNRDTSVDVADLEAFLACVSGPAAPALPGCNAFPPRQAAIDRVESMPNMPQPYAMRDWNAVARGFDLLAFNPQASGQYLPLVWLLPSGSSPTGYGLPSYVGDYRTDENGRVHEGITCLGAVLGATVAGVNKAQGTYNWVRLATHHFNTDPAQRLVLNRGSSGGSFWYDILPHLIFYGIADRYPQESQLQSILTETAGRWYDACVALGGGPQSAPDFNHTAFDFAVMQPVDNGVWKEPDAGAGVAWLQYMAYVRTGEQRFLNSTDWCLRYLQGLTANPVYEAMLPFGAYTAARMNAEEGRAYEVGKLINWCFDRSETRPDWGVLANTWLGHDVHGLAGAVNRPPRSEGGGYAFAMNTYCMAWPLVPLVRYDDRYARAIGKWVLNAANAARLFYANAHPPSRQSCPSWAGDPTAVIAYEGLKHRWLGSEELYASGDPLTYGWGPQTDFGVYGSALVGIFGGIIQRTNVDGILQLNLLATDFFRRPAYPSFLYFNPHMTNCDVTIHVGSRPVDLYDAVSNRFLARSVTGNAVFTLAADNAVILVLVPADAVMTRQGGRTLMNNIVVDYRSN